MCALFNRNRILPLIPATISLFCAITFATGFVQAFETPEIATARVFEGYAAIGLLVLCINLGLEPAFTSARVRIIASSIAPVGLMSAWCYLSRFHAGDALFTSKKTNAVAAFACVAGSATNFHFLIGYLMLAWKGLPPTAAPPATGVPPPIEIRVI